MSDNQIIALLVLIEELADSDAVPWQKKKQRIEELASEMGELYTRGLEEFLAWFEPAED